MTHTWRTIMEEHRASMRAYKKVHNETVISELRMTIVQQSMKMDIYDIKQVLAQTREQMGIRANRVEEDQSREEWNQKIEELKNLIQSFIRNPLSPERLGNKSDQKHNVTGDSCEEGDNMIELCGHTNHEKVADEYGGKKLPQTDSTLKDLDTKDIGVLELANSQDNKNPTWAGDQSRIRENDVPSHGPRKQYMGGQIFCAGLELTVGFDLRAFKGLNCDLGRGEERITWNLGINHHPSDRKWNSGLNSFIELITMNDHVFQHFRPNDDRHERRVVQRRVWDPRITQGYILKQHLEDKVFLGAGVLIRTCITTPSVSYYVSSLTF
ncbi:hypothetical protein Tco_0891665 [Tanacetum coccineum]|uniref:Uncharacterized protein n=1 Tax=Tanacetum coccineum TaxID=301880 RepID=A0ABQ5C540_9ASTR